MDPQQRRSWRVIPANACFNPGGLQRVGSLDKLIEGLIEPPRMSECIGDHHR